MLNAVKSAVLATTILAGSAQAATLVPGTAWTKFLFGGTGSALTDEATGDSSYDFTLTGSAYLDATDAFIIGDVFTLFNGASLIGTTGAFDTGGSSTVDPDVAFGGSVYSWGRWTLGPGTYSINGVASTSCCGGGGAFIRLSNVPEPESWMLMIAGFGLVGAVMRRRESARVTA